MDQVELTPKEMKRLSGALYFPWMAFYFITVDNAFSDLSLIAIGGAGTALNALPAARYMAAARFVMVGVMFILVSKWYSPIGKFVKTFDQGLKTRVRAKVSHIYGDMYLFFAICAAARLLTYAACGVFSGLTWGVFFKDLLPAMLLVLAAQLGIALANIDSMLGWSDVLISRLYDKEELYSIRPGTSIPLSVKMSVLVTVCAILPLGLIIFAANRQVPLQLFSASLWPLGVVCIATLLVGMRFMLGSVQRPLEGLIEKMARIGLGDYNVKSRIYFSDELARLKDGFNGMVDGLREREEIKETFGRYMSIEIARELLKGGKVNLGGEEVEAAVMFCDIRNFTPLSERMTPAQVVEFLNAYFSFITPPISEHNGVINKFIGDAVMAIYTPLLGSENYAAEALRSALGMRRALAAFNASGKGPGEVRFGIGIQTGKLIAGNIGTTARLEYTFIGDTVNIASRLEAKTKEVGTDILITRTVLDRLGVEGGGARFESVGQVELKGKREPLELYKVL